jgi:cytochrome b subunit of formate dehydrogenase
MTIDVFAKDSPEIEALRTYVEQQIQREIKERVDPSVEIPRAQLRALTAEAMEAGAEEIDFAVRNLVKDARRARVRRMRHAARAAKSKTVEVPRFSLFFRLQHIVLASSVLLLIITGAPIKFHESLLGDIVASAQIVDAMRIVHRVAAAALTLVSLVHLIWVIFSREGWTNFVALVPRKDDFIHFVQQTKYLFGKSKEKPYFGRFNYIEKFDYWAVYWGVIIMVGTGTLLTFNTYFMNMLGQYSMHIGKLIHSDEALLASLALLIWHIYWSHLNPAKFPMNPSFLTGTMTMDDMIEEHPAELETRVRRGEIPLDDLDGYPEWWAMHPRADSAKATEGEDTPS